MALTQYELSRSFWDFTFANPEKVKPTHIAIYFFAIEHCNRLGWKEKFGLPTSMVLEAIGVKSYNSYKTHFDDLVSWGAIKVIEYSKNQYSSNIVALSNALSKNNKALDKATKKHSESTIQSTGESTGSIDKPITNNIKPKGFIPTDKQKESFEKFQQWIIDEVSEIAKMKKPFTIKEYVTLTGEMPDAKSPTGFKPGISKKDVIKYLQAIENNNTYLKKYRSPYLCVLAWHKNDNK